MRQHAPGGDYVFVATENDSELVLMKGGRLAYLWVGARDGAGPGDTYVFSGPAGLRALARAILREVPVPKKRGRK